MDPSFSPLAHLAMALIFIVGYAMIVLEHNLKINKAASAIFTGCVLWIIYFAASPTSHDENMNMLGHQLQSVSEIVFFLLGAMTIVELIDSHNGFSMLTNFAKPMSKRAMVALIGLLTFFMSSVLDNLTTTLVMVTLLRRLIAEREERLLVGGLVVIAANAGGAWTPIGDVTTTMLWIRGCMSTWPTMTSLFLPSFLSLVAAVLWISRGMKGSFEKPDLSLQPRELMPGAKIIMFCGVLTFVMVPVFKAVTHLPAYMGILVGLSLLWILTDWFHQHHDKPLRVSHALTRIDSSSLLFFLGILLSIGALEHAGLLQKAAYGLDSYIPSKAVITTFIGLISAVIDNVPLVAATMSMYPLSQFSMDHALWQWIAFCAGTGGSILIVGSAAGVAFMGLEQVSFVWYARRIGICAFVSFIVGIVTLAMMGIVP